MIMYFTGTGNSRFVAEALAERLGDEVVSLNDVMRGERPARFETAPGKPFVVVFPVYAWRMPDPVVDLLHRGVFEGDGCAYFVATMGADFGAAGAGCERLAGELGLEYGGLAGVVMPDNCIRLFDMPTPEAACTTIRAALPAVDAAAATIAAGGTFEDDQRGRLLSKIKSSGALHAGFSRMVMSDKGFRVADACTGCGLCERSCPTCNVALVDGRPTFSGHCCACYACIQHCPQCVIDIKGHTEKRGRYVCPEYRDFA